jgi:hypothetical protein
MDPSMAKRGGSIRLALVLMACAGLCSLNAQDPLEDELGMADPELRLEGLDLGMEVEDLMRGIRIWDKSINVRTAGGYKDNVFPTSPMAREPSSFFLSGLDLMIWRLPLDGTQLTFFGSFEDTRYFSADPVDGEQMAVAFAQVQRMFRSDWKAGLSLQYHYQDQVIDLLEHEVLDPTAQKEVTALAFLGHRFGARPSLRWEFARPYWAELQVGITRQYLEWPFDDYWEQGPKLVLGRDFGKQADVTLSYEYLHRPHDERVQATVEGIRIPGRPLAMHVQRVEATWRQYWDAQRHWRTTTRLLFENQEDNGSGYYDFQRWQIAQQLRYAAGKWELRAQARLAYTEYPLQTVSSTDLTTRRRTSIRASFRAQRELFRTIKLFGEYEHDRSISRLGLDDYAVNTFLSGIDWEF